jgi:ATP-dependent Clp protease, protease subunit
MKDKIDFKIPEQKERNLFFAEQVDQKSMVELTRQIIEINEYDDYMDDFYKINELTYVRKPIKIYIDSYGGYVYQCFGLLSVIEASKTPVHTIVTGCAMSCGFMILISGHKRFGYELSTPLYHQVSNGFHGKLKDMEEDYIETKRLQDMIEAIVLRKTKIGRKKLDKIYTRKIDWTMNAEEAIKFGVIDEIIK